MCPETVTDKKTRFISTFGELLERWSDSQRNQYIKTLNTTKECTLDWLDSKPNEISMFREIVSKEFSSLPIRQIVDEWRENSPELLDKLLIQFSPIEDTNLGGNRPINLFYADFLDYLRIVHYVTDDMVHEPFGKYEGNCAQYSAFMMTFIQEAMPELNPVLVFGDCTRTRRGIVNERPVEHFWLKLHDGTILDNSGLFYDIYNNYRVQATCTDFLTENPTWTLDEEASEDGGWFNTYVEEAMAKSRISKISEIAINDSL